MTPLVAGGLVFFTSGAVLVLEILAVRLLAPYVGVTLETYTAIIGTLLGGIAAGTWVGGYVADRLDPRAMLGPLLVAGGVLSLATLPLVRVLGALVSRGEGLPVLTLSTVIFFAPAAVLSAVSPTVVKLQLNDLTVTGRVVGRLSALGTAGAIVGTFLAGFVLVEAAPTSTSISVLGAVLVGVGAVLWLWLSRRSSGGLPAVALLGLIGLLTSAAAGNPCDEETAYHCVRVVHDERRPGGRILVLDTLQHSYVDVNDPTYLDFPYAKVFADVVAATAPPGRIDVLHIGGGGFTMPRYLSSLRPGSTHLVLEIDPGLVEVARQRLSLRTGPDIGVRIGDARLLVDNVGRGGTDVVLGDAFGGVAVPWHLTTIEFVRAVRSTLRPGGVYVMNVIDRPPMRFARAEATTLLEAFGHVAVVAPRSVLEARQSGNVVLVASDAEIDVRRITALIAARQGAEEVLGDGAAAEFAGDAPVLTDDHAPVDQWLARARSAGN